MGMTEPDRTAVLVVEDERELADRYSSWLEDDYAAYTAYAGQEAIELLESHPIDIVLLDRRLPGIPGNEVLSEIRNRGHDCRVALITAVDPDFDIIEMDIDEYVVKPVTKDELPRIVERLRSIDEYEEKLQELVSMASKLHVLKEEKTTNELQTHGEYQQLKRRFERLREQTDETVTGFESRDFKLIYRELGSREER